MLTNQSNIKLDMHSTVYAKYLYEALHTIDALRIGETFVAPGKHCERSPIYMRFIYTSGRYFLQYLCMIV